MPNETNQTTICAATGGKEETEQAFTEVHINVTPLVVDGPDAVCRIEARGASDAAYLDHGLIRLPPGPPVDLYFHLQDGGFPELVFAEQPWSSRHRECPAPGENDFAQFPHASKENDKLAKVRATPTPPNSRHYSLNFDGGIRCDPVIIRD